MKISNFKFALFIAMSVILSSAKGYSCEEVIDNQVNQPLVKKSNTATIARPWVLPDDIARPWDFADEIHKTILSNFDPIDDISDLGQLSSTCKCWHYLLKDTVQASKNRIFFIGSTQSGKSTLINLLWGKPLNAERNMLGYFRLTAAETVPNVNIDHWTAGTLQPTGVVDRYNKRIVIDCPGFRDARRDEQDWVNSQALYKHLKKGNVSVVLVEPEASLTRINKGRDFILRLNKMTEIFPDQGQLQTLLSVVVTKQKNLISTAYFDMLGNGEVALLTPRGRQLAKFLATIPGHIVNFKEPRQEGPYEATPELLSFLDNVQYVANPIVTPPVKESVTHSDEQGRWSSPSSYYQG